MSEPTSEKITTGAGPGDISAVAETTRFMLGQELAIAGRLESKAHNGLILAAGWFAAVQTVTGLALPKNHGWVLLSVILSGAFLAWSFYLSRKVWAARTASDIKPEFLTMQLTRSWKSIDGSREAEFRIANQAIKTLERFREDNKARGEDLRSAERWTATSFGVSLGQMLLVLMVAVNA